MTKQDFDRRVALKEINNRGNTLNIYVSETAAFKNVPISN
jgi:hypothetical protein